MSKYTIIYPPVISWNEPIFQRPHQLFLEFSKQNYFSIFTNSINDNKGIFWYANPNLCISNNLQLTLSNKDIIRKISDSTKVMWVTFPPNISLKPLVNPDIIIFDYIDEITDEFDFWKDKYEECLRSSNIIITTSRRLYELVSVNFKDKTYLVSNGVDTDYYFKNEYQLPEELKKIKAQYSHIIGFTGTLHTWIDYELIKEISLLKPDWAFVFIGPKYCNTKLIDGISNIIYLGSKNYGDLINYIKNFDAAIIPFQVRNMTNSANPIKMYEYLAAGIPVITTPIRECLALAPYVRTAKTAEEYVEKIAESISKASSEQIYYKEIALQNSWTNKVNFILNILDNINQK